ncbi:AraC family transcriptional regulator [Psychroflexus sediminis]|uniref:Transcriptional regulator, AraC family n=1 Tax=Psychroflexus sediminis TaxID=470826 RepID=A0A1G7VCM6_9FLAO|nr:AraC family transcriptional regulator [Psychroflexus sediminis]SDG57311.1 transcriptional regulator, AraC family [Psychroflexus sediminis]
MLQSRQSPRKIETLVENRRVYSADFAEMNIYETRKKADQVYLEFDFPIIASMISGKKIMHLENKATFDFLPGESVVLPAKKKMIIDFPEATIDSPTLCMALGIDSQKIQETIEAYQNATEIEDHFVMSSNLNLSPLHLNNNMQVQQLIDRLLQTFTSGHKSKDALLDLMIKELILRLLQTNARAALLDETSCLFDNNRMAFVLKYIRENYREDISVENLADKACMSSSHFYKTFKNTLGETPIEYLNRERLKQAKKLIRTSSSKLSEIAFSCGFNSSSYFNTQFKKQEGMTPSQFRKSFFD